MELCFEEMLYSNLGNENSDSDRIKWSRWPQVPHPYLDNGFDEFAKIRQKVRQVYCHRVKDKRRFHLEKTLHFKELFDWRLSPKRRKAWWPWRRSETRVDVTADL